MRRPSALCALALLAAGCGAGATAPAATTATGPLAYSACMRAHGIAGFPDPNAKGNLIVTPADHFDPSSPIYRAAEGACAKLQVGPGGGMTPAQQEHVFQKLYRYVLCMRKHGIPMADPFKGANSGVGIVVPRSIDPASAAFTSADEACKPLIPNG